MSEDAPAMSPAERADAIEHQMVEDLDTAIILKSVVFTSGDRDPTQPLPRSPAWAKRRFLMGDDPRLPRLPAAPTLADFFRLRFAPAAHMLQSATHALRGGHDEKVVLACLLHDIAVIGFIRGDHGYFGAQMIEPYVDEEVSWAVRMHQALRFYADESVGYAYPETYLSWFGPDYRPEPYIERAYQEARRHKWYMTSRLITLNDIYSFDPNAVVKLEEFTDIIGRHFHGPKEGLGRDSRPAAHLWRTIERPTRFL